MPLCVLVATGTVCLICRAPLNCTERYLELELSSTGLTGDFFFIAGTLAMSVCLPYAAIHSIHLPLGTTSIATGTANGSLPFPPFLPHNCVADEMTKEISPWPRTGLPIGDSPESETRRARPIFGFVCVYLPSVTGAESGRVNNWPLFALSVLTLIVFLFLSYFVCIGLERRTLDRWVSMGSLSLFSLCR